jgi:hypothetical protein
MTRPSEERDFLCRLLEKRFGRLNAEELEMIQSADGNFLDRIGDALLSSTTMKEVFIKARGMDHRLSKRAVDIELQIASFLGEN